MVEWLTSGEGGAIVAHGDREERQGDELSDRMKERKELQNLKI